MSKDQKLVKIKRDTKSLVMKNLIVMAVLIIIALTGVISWFTNKDRGKLLMVSMLFAKHIKV